MMRGKILLIPQKLQIWGKILLSPFSLEEVNKPNQTSWAILSCRYHLTRSPSPSTCWRCSRVGSWKRRRSSKQSRTKKGLRLTRCLLSPSISMPSSSPFSSLSSALSSSFSSLSSSSSSLSSASPLKTRNDGCGLEVVKVQERFTNQEREEVRCCSFWCKKGVGRQLKHFIWKLPFQFKFSENFSLFPGRRLNINPVPPKPPFKDYSKEKGGENPGIGFEGNFPGDVKSD